MESFAKFEFSKSLLPMFNLNNKVCRYDVDSTIGTTPINTISSVRKSLVERDLAKISSEDPTEKKSEPGAEHRSADVLEHIPKKIGPSGRSKIASSDPKSLSRDHTLASTDVYDKSLKETEHTPTTGGDDTTLTLATK